MQSPRHGAKPCLLYTSLKAIPEVRKVTGDRAVVRAIHFYNDSRRAGEIYEAINADDFDRVLQLIIEGGHSSFEFNQNAYSIKNPQEQGVPLALALSLIHICNGEIKVDNTSDDATKPTTSSNITVDYQVLFLPEQGLN